MKADITTQREQIHRFYQKAVAWENGQKNRWQSVAAADVIAEISRRNQEPSEQFAATAKSVIRTIIAPET